MSNLTTNYFDFFDIPVAFGIDQGLLKRRYFELSREYHPDYHTLGDEEDRTDALDMASFTNEAYSVLREEGARWEYVLRLNNVWKEDDMTVPQDFLMEVMELNEGLMELELDYSESIAARVNAECAALERGMEDELSKLTSEYDSCQGEELLGKIKSALLKKRYLLRIREKINKFASLSSEGEGR